VNLDDDRRAIVGRAMPATVVFLALAYLALALVVAGLPPLSGFLGKVAMLSGRARSGRPRRGRATVAARARSGCSSGCWSSPASSPRWRCRAKGSSNSGARAIGRPPRLRVVECIAVAIPLACCVALAPGRRTRCASQPTRRARCTARRCTCRR
jgi:multicomponent K+:H+ antiporter subunit D